MLRGCIPSCPSRQPAGVDALGDMVVVGRRGDRQHLADRLNPMRLAVIVDERDRGLNRRSSFAWAKYAEALLSLACEARGSRVPEPSVSSQHPWELRRARRRHARLSCSRSWRRSMKPPPSATYARVRDPEPAAPRGVRTSGENLLVALLVMVPPSQELEPPINPGRNTTRGTDQSGRKP